MNKETLASLQRMAERFRSDVVRGDYDERSILTFILSYIDEQLKYEIDSTKNTNIYK